MKNTKPKIFFIDLDGTLLDKMDHNIVSGNLINKISQENKDAIIEAQKEKVIIISTGRAPNLVLPLIQALNIPYAVTQNGALVINSKGKVIYKKEMNAKTSLKLIRFCKQHKLAIKVNDQTIMYGVSWIMKYPIRHFGWETSGNYDRLEEQTTKQIKYSKLVLAGKTKGSMRRLCKYLMSKEVDLNISAVTSTKGLTIEVTDQEATKGKGNAYLVKKLGFKNSEAVHLGDTMNDSTTKGIMKLIVMGNATKELKAIADEIGPNFRHGGVGKILLKKD